MNRTMHAVAGIVGLAAAVGGGYWWGMQRSVSAVPAAMTAGVAPDAGGKTARKLLYYRNPMGLPDTSPVPKKDSMGMDYIPVYEGEDAADGDSGIKVSVEKIQKLGVRTETAQKRTLERVVRAAGRVEVDERRRFAIAPRFEGWVERLHVNVTGQIVGKGQPLFEVYSPELVSVQREYAIAASGASALAGARPEARAALQELALAGLARLKNWEISDEQIQALARGGEPRRSLTFRSPVSGVVLEKKAVQGMRFMPGEALYEVADLSSVWVIADVFEQDIGLVRVGAKARVSFNAYPGETFDGHITYVYPTLKAETRTVSVRIELSNPGGRLKPAMFAHVELTSRAGRGVQVITVPVSAVIDSGTRQVVFVQKGEGRFEPRPVKLGARSNEHVEVLDGVAEGEPVVVAANFLIDAESNLKAAFGGMVAPASGGGGGAIGVGHHAAGTLDAIDQAAGSVTITHGPVASLNWPAMTMDFQLAHRGLLGALKPGASVAFDFVERKPGEWVVTGFRDSTASGGTPVAPVRPAKSATPTAPAAHAGH